MSKPVVVCLCGSTRFGEAFAKANLEETLAGRIVLTIGCNMKSDAELFAHFTEEEREDIKTKLDDLHKRKIDLADEILVLNVGGYVGSSTKSEIEYAWAHGKAIRWLEPQAEQQPTKGGEEMSKAFPLTQIFLATNGQLELSKQVNKEIGEYQELKKACMGLIEYRKHNTINFQLEKADVWLRDIELIIENKDLG